VIPPKGPTCIWGCGRSNFNREHIIGRNVAKHLGVDYPTGVPLGDSPSQQEVPDARVELRKARQQRLGRWAVKIALLLQVWMHDLQEAEPDLDLEPPHAAADHFHKLMGGHPQKGTRVWVGAS
jgi:hypothetical protein